MPVKLVSFDRFQLNSIGQKLNSDHGNIFRQDPNLFFYKLNKISWELPKIIPSESENVQLFEYRCSAVSN